MSTPELLAATPTRPVSRAVAEDITPVPLRRSITDESFLRTETIRWKSPSTMPAVSETIPDFSSLRSTPTPPSLFTPKRSLLPATTSLRRIILSFRIPSLAAP